MAKIHVLSSETIDKIAAGEVVERPNSVVKELVENAMDAGATSITVEIKEGGISFIRITDNGTGIEKSEIRNAFLRHATSKIETAEDLSNITSLGFRGEALSSICAVAQVEVITKVRDSLTGIRFCIDGGVEKEYAEIGAPDGTTILVRNLFFNTPVRRKFLKQPATEGGYIIDLMEHMALSSPEVAFKLVVNGQVKFHTSGNGKLLEVIYRIYGREIANNLIPISAKTQGILLSGYLGKPVLNRSNRNFETFFINHRYVKSNVISKAIEDGYSQYLMQHKFPFVVLHMDVDTKMVDVNVHPAKMEVRFIDGEAFYDFIAREIDSVLSQKEMIPDVLEEKEAKPEVKKQTVPEPFETKRAEAFRVEEEVKYHTDMPKLEEKERNPIWNRIKPEPEKETEITKTEQLSLFEDKMLSAENVEKYDILGQIFDTYWLIAFSDKLYMVDQHAAHEKVKYEKLMVHYRSKSITSQNLNPPIVVTLSAKEEQVYQEYSPYFEHLGFEIEEFGGNDYAIRAVPTDLYGLNEKEMFLSVLDELIDGPVYKNLNLVEEKLASMACKSAVKGNHHFSRMEMESLIAELLKLDNPYNCPHGRPTIISMSRYEIEKMFKRIV